MNETRNAALGVTEGLPGWQPIGTAPRVGVFLVYLPDERRNFEVMYRGENNISIVGGAFGFDRTAPTHWMPLPAPPDAALAVKP